MSTSKYAENFQALIELSDGLSCRLHNLKTNLSNSHFRPQCLSNQEFKKIRQSLEKTFPETDISKVQGYDIFLQSAASISNQLSYVNDILLDLIEFKNTSSQLLTSFPLEVLDLKIQKNKCVIMKYFHLFTNFMKCLYILSTIDERKILVSILWAASSFTFSASRSNTGDMVNIFNQIENLNRYFIDHFNVVAPFVGMLISQFQQSLLITMDCDKLRQHNVLNPVHEGEAIGQPARLLIAHGNQLSMYSELADREKYIEIIIFSYIACPSLLATPEHFGLYRLVTSDNILLPIFRDITINTHTEMDRIFSIYPTKKDFNAPMKTTKFRSDLKDIYRTALGAVSLRHLEVRSYLLGELSSLNKLFTAVPGLLGPKFPMAYAVAFMANAEILHYFRHLTVDVRKEALLLQTSNTQANKLASQNLYPTGPCLLITNLIQQLSELNKLIITHKLIITKYYIEFAKNIDYKNLLIICSDCAPHIRPLGQTICSTLASISSDLSFSNSDTPSDALSLFNFRLRCERINIAFASKSSIQIGKLVCVNELLFRLQPVFERSQFIDNIDHLSHECFSPTQLHWYSSQTLETFRMALADACNPMICPLAILSVFPTAVRNAHQDCPEEYVKLGEASRKLCDEYLHELGVHVTSAFLELWGQFLVFDNQIQQIEAVKLLRQRVGNVSAGAGVSEDQAAVSPPTTEQSFPGSESHPWETKKLQKIIDARAKLTSILSAARHINRLKVYSKEYDIQSYLRTKLGQTIHDKLQGTIMELAMERHTTTLRKIITGFKTLQSILLLIDIDSTILMKDIIDQNFIDNSLPAEDLIIPLNFTSSNPNMLIWKLSTAFTHFIDKLSLRDSTCIWIPCLNVIARLRTLSTSITMVTDHVVGMEEMKSLSTFIGVRGVRALDVKLLAYTTSKVSDMLSFIGSHQKLLYGFGTDVNADANAIITSAGKLTNIVQFMQNALHVGMALVFREMLHAGLQEIQMKYTPAAREVMDLAVKVVKRERLDPEVWTSSPATTDALDALASATGALPTVDISLVAALSQFRSADKLPYAMLLPEAFCALLTASIWNSATFVPEYEVFSGNEHVLMLCVARLLQAIHPKAVYEKEAARFLQLASQSLLLLRDREMSQGSNTGIGVGSLAGVTPLRSMMLLPEMFVDQCPCLRRSVLEKCLPFALSHACRVVDISSDGHGR